MKTNHLLEPLESRIAPALMASGIFASTLNGSNGFKVSGDGTDDYTGSTVSNAGDFNGDGFDDFLVGAPYLNDGGVYTGGAYVIFGKGTAGPANLNPSQLNGTNGFLLMGENGGDFAGMSVSAAGDFNGDGLGDILIGASGSGPDSGTVDVGAAYIVYGTKSVIGGPMSLSSLNGQNGFKLVGGGAGHGLGGAVASAGDFNKDGYDDVIIGAVGANGDATGSGAAYVVLGRAAVQSDSYNISSFGYKIGGIAVGDAFGSSVAGGGDVNGDGFDDVVIGAIGANSGGTDRGAAYVVFGKSQPTNVAVSGLGGSNGFRMEGTGDGDRAGGVVAIVGDINGDGFDDVAVGAKFADEGGNNMGSVHVLFGHSGPFTQTFTLSGTTFDGVKGFKLVGAGDGDFAGGSVQAAGDLNGDGFEDLIVGAENAHVAQDERGLAYVYYGHNDTFTASRSLAVMSDTVGFTLRGAGANDHFGAAVSYAGDLNGDGYSDLVVGAPNADPNGNESGAAYVVYGGPVGYQTAIDISADHKSATFFDTDGDKVTVKITKGDIANLDFDMVGKSILQGKLLTLHVPQSMAGTDLIITTKPTENGGDGQINFGFLDATGVDLGKVSITGNVEHIAAGNVNTPGLAVKSLTVQSLGESVLPYHDTFGKNYKSTFEGAIGPVTIKSDVNQALVLVSGGISKLTIGGSMIAGEGGLSGYLSSGGKIASINVGGSLLGQEGSGGGSINAAKSIGAITIGHDVKDAYINAAENLSKLTVGGSLIRSSAQNNGAVYAGITLGPVLVKGDIIGAEDAPFSLQGNGPLTGNSSTAISSVTVNGDVENSLIVGGRLAKNGHAQIGKVLVKGDWTASSIVAGALTSLNNNSMLNFGNGDDVLGQNGPANVVSKIASITINGSVKGTADGGDHFGFVAQQIGSLKIGGVSYALNAGKSNDLINLGPTGDVKLREL